MVGFSSIPENLKRLVQIRSDEGYMAELRKTDTGWLFIENHCPICAAATHCQGFCSNELGLFRELMGADVCVERSEYLLDGGSRCTYEVSLSAPGQTA